MRNAIRSADPDAKRQYFDDLFGWKVASEGAFPGYTFIDTGAEGGPYVAISPRQGDQDGQGRLMTTGRRVNTTRNPLDVMGARFEASCTDDRSARRPIITTGGG